MQHLDEDRVRERERGQCSESNVFDKPSWITFRRKHGGDARSCLLCASLSICSVCYLLARAQKLRPFRLQSVVHLLFNLRRSSPCLIGVCRRLERCIYMCVCVCSLRVLQCLWYCNCAHFSEFSYI